MFGYAYRGSDDMNYPTWFEKSDNKLKFCFWPRTCYQSKKSIWLRFAYRSRRWFRDGDITMHSEDRWFDSNEFLILRLKYGV